MYDLWVFVYCWLARCLCWSAAAAPRLRRLVHLCQPHLHRLSIFPGFFLSPWRIRSFLPCWPRVRPIRPISQSTASGCTGSIAAPPPRLAPLWLSLRAWAHPQPWFLGWAARGMGRLIGIIYIGLSKIILARPTRTRFFVYRKMGDSQLNWHEGLVNVAAWGWMIAISIGLTTCRCCGFPRQEVARRSLRQFPRWFLAGQRLIG